ncbi:MAG: hypothetical protein WA139_04985 [Candidatus Aenigmatarchaeota archaeon]
MPQIDFGGHTDVADKFLESIKSVYSNADKKLSEKGIKPALPRKIRLRELPGKIGFEKYMKKEKGKLYVFVVPNVQKVFGYYDPVKDEAVIDPILLKDTEFSKIMKEYGLKMRQPSLTEVLAEETIVHKLQKDAGAIDKSGKYKYGREAIEGLAGALKEYLGIDVVAYPYETCVMKKILKESGISPTDSLYGGHKKDIYGEFSARAADCYERGKCSCS